MASAILAAEKIWRIAYDEDNHIGSARSHHAEQNAWDAYAELCDEAGQCLEPGCRTHTPEYAWCPTHRAR